MVESNARWRLAVNFQDGRLKDGLAEKRMALLSICVSASVHVFCIRTCNRLFLLS